MVLILMLLVLSSAQAADIQGVRLYRAPDNTRIVFDLTGMVEYRVTSTPKTADKPAQVVVDLSNVALGSQVVLPDTKGTPVGHMATERRNDFDLRVTLDLTIDVTAKSFLLKPNAPYGHRLVIDLADNVVAPVAEPAPITATESVNAAQGRDILIVVDAGHGGEDPGASGPGGVHEKDVTLKIARELASVINQQKGYRAHLTRATDYFIPLQGRSKIAMDKKADLFVSIHADAFKDKTARGSSVFAWSQRGATSTTAKFLADSENLSDLMGGADPNAIDDDVLKTMADMSRDGAVQYSLGMGRDILGEIGKITRLHKHHVEQAGFMVLKSVRVPSLLIETGFISNPQEVEKLTSPDYQHKLATAVFAGIDDYFRRVPPPDTYVAAVKNGGVLPGKVIPVAKPVIASASAVIETTEPENKTSSGKKKSARTNTQTQPRIHMVKRGETLSGIAKQYGVTMSAIKKRNKMKNSVVWVGQHLKIPTE